MKNILTISGIALGVYLLFNYASKGNQSAAAGTISAETTSGERLTLRNIGGFIIDERGRVWL